MKKLSVSLFMLFSLLMLVNAQEVEKKDSCNLSFDVTADLVSRYIWRGVDFGNAPAIQPTVVMTYKNISIGAWGSNSISSNTGGLEADLFLEYSLPFGLIIGVSDYYFPGEKLPLSIDDDSLGFNVGPARRFDDYFDYQNLHFIEANMNYTFKNLTLSANYMLQNWDNAMYFELSYNIKNLTIFAGGGNEVYTSDGEFRFCNTGVTIKKDLEVTDNYSLPLGGSFIINPDLKQVHMAFAITF